MTLFFSMLTISADIFGSYEGMPIIQHLVAEQKGIVSNPDSNSRIRNSHGSGIQKYCKKLFFLQYYFVTGSVFFLYSRGELPYIFLNASLK